MASADDTDEQGADLLAPLQQELNAAPRNSAARIELEFLSGTEPEWMPALLLRRDAEISEQLEEHVKVMGGRPGKYKLRLKVGGKVVRSATMRLTFAVPPPVAAPVPPAPASDPPQVPAPGLRQQLKAFKAEQAELMEVARELAPPPPDPDDSDGVEEEDDEDEEDDEPEPTLVEKFLAKALESDKAGTIVESLALKLFGLLDAKTEGIIERNKLTAMRIQRLSGVQQLGGNAPNGAPRVLEVERVEGGE